MIESRDMVTKEGFYLKVGKDIVGIYMSNEGPKLFINREVFELHTPCWDVEMVMGKSRHLISFYWCGEVKLSVSFDGENELFLNLYHYLSYRTNEKRLA